MKIRQFIYGILASAAIFAACEKEEDLGQANISLSPSAHEFSHDGGSVTIAVNATRNWVVEKSSIPNWISVSPMSGNASKYATNITVTVEANPLFERTAEIKFVAEDKKATLEISQKGAARIISLSEFVGKPGYDSSNQEWFFLEGEIVSILDSSTGDLMLTDESRAMYVEVKGMTATRQDTNDKSFSSLGLQIGDVVTFSGVKGAGYEVGGPGLPVAYYISHKTPSIEHASRSTVDDVFSIKAKSVAVKGKVVAVSTTGLVINDGGAKNLFVSNPEGFGSIAQGDAVEVQGKVTRNPVVSGDGVKLVYLSGDGRYPLSVKKISDEFTVNEQEPVELEGSAADSYMSDNSAKVKVNARVLISGQTRYLEIEGATVRGVAASTDLDSRLVSGMALEITGYFTGVGNGRELHLIPIAVQESLVPYFKVTPSMLTFAADDNGRDHSQVFTVESNIGYEQWTVTSSNPDELQVEQNAMSVRVIPTANTTLSERTYTVTVSHNGVSAVVDVIQSAPASDKDLEILLDVSQSSSVISDDFPTSATGGQEAATYDILNQNESDSGIYKWTFTPVGGSYFHNTRFKALQIGKNGANILLPAVEGKKLTSVVLVSGSRNSCEKAAVYTTDGTSVLTGGDAPADGMGKSKETVWNLGGTQNNTSYQLRVCSDANLQIQKLTLIYR